MATPPVSLKDFTRTGRLVRILPTITTLGMCGSTTASSTTSPRAATTYQFVESVLFSGAVAQPS
ncbi:MAG: hypothetical protein IJ630_09960 [Treponema sp.]|nr:hypothetical protein [Treponema sp.]